MDTFTSFKLIFASVFALAGTLFLCIAYHEWRSSYSLVTLGVQTEGTVIETYRKPRRTGESASSAEAPVIQFVTQRGEIKKYYSTLFTTPCSHQPGERVPIWYLPNDPARATLNGADAWILPIMFGIFGSVISLIAYSSLISLLLKTIFHKP